jgi:ArsR family transcriptional regulator
LEDKIKYIQIFKALADDTRLNIVEMLSCGEMCACDILASFQITQPTLSYHLKLLTDCGLINARKEGSWMRYSINEELVSSVKGFLDFITTEHDSCNCKTLKEAGKCD